MKRFLAVIVFFFSFSCVFAEQQLSLKDIKRDELVKICKVWGFLKYYHPSLSRNKYNWDKELFNVFLQIANNNDHYDVNSILESLVDKLGKIPLEHAKSLDQREGVKFMPDNSWICDTSHLGISLSNKLVKIESARRSKSSYYFQYVPSKNIAMPTNENAYNNINLDDKYTLLSLFRFWNVIQYFYPYKYLIGESWDSVLYKYIPKMFSVKTNKEYILTLMNLTAEINDAHVYVRNQDSVFGKRTIPIILSVIENKIIITGFYNNIIYDSSSVKVGDEVLEIDGQSTREQLTNLLPYCTGVNIPTKLRVVCDKLILTNKEEVSLKVTNSEGIHTRIISTYPSSKLNEKSRFQEMKEPIYIKDSIAYIYIGSLTNNVLEKKIPEILNTCGVILDFRGYPIDDAIGNLIDYFLPREKVKFYQTTVPNILYPGTFLFEKENPSFFISSEQKISYLGKIVVLVDERTQSSAEFYTMMASIIPKATIIGSQTAGTDGPAIPLFLPNNILVRYTGMGIYYPNRTETQRIGIIRSENISRTVKGVTSGLDPLIIRGIEIIKEER
jgi:C-terminal processing protease CtpA/Prc